MPLLRTLRHAVVDVSASGRPGEVAAWSNGASAAVLGAGAAALAWDRLAVSGAWVGVAVFVATFFALRLSLTRRGTLWIAAGFGTVTVGAMGGALAWLFAHVVDVPALPSVAAVLGAAVASLGPAWAYRELARRRATGHRDSLVDPVSVPYSR
ncbi:MAG: hypothetical protein JWP97_2293 [Labilithrix sp.]|nr:hypothetical protein [Labilithrix sp.]